METILENQEVNDNNESIEIKPEVDSENQEEEENTLEEISQGPSTLGAIANALKSDLKAQVEAVLFVTDLPVKTGAIAKMLNAAYEDVQSALVQLIQEYEDRNGGLEIGTDDGYIIQVKTQYLNIVTDMMPLELNPGPMRTLSAIALKEPVLQSEVIDMRGSGAYDHINELVEMDLITKKPQGLSYILKTTKKFQQYFRLTQDAAKIKERLQEEALRRTKEKEKQKELEEALKNEAANANTEQPQNVL
ncbi:MAG: SMC-Scp complex subunit ScpB [Candidatus Melainabacteria bacterium RIFCSPHIGHO2_02_FULL_34_12]|nr:MAG: SMC-Scp complex subunit ScpB [Candidatus Melainabacteria bacterium RIFCSPHIGHO2_02_FULL_34_12]